METYPGICTGTVRMSVEQPSTTPLLSRDVLPRQVFRGHIPDCCGLIIRNPVSLRVRVFSAISGDCQSMKTVYFLVL